MNKLSYIRDKAQYLFYQVAVDGDELDLHVIEGVLEEVFQAGIEEAKQQQEHESQ